MTRTPRGNDDGAALILVLVLVMVIAVGLGALLSFADSSLRTTVNLRDQAATVADADGAVQAAITNIRNGTFHAAAGTHCFGGSDTLNLPAFDGTTSAAVGCTADPATVRIQCPSLSQCNRPGDAILTLGTVAGEDGLTISQPTTSNFRVHGRVYSNSTINVVNGTLSTTGGGVFARGTCTGTIKPTPSCSYAGTTGDPGYAPDISTVPALRKAPACTTANSVVKFSPGYYDDASVLNDMMAGNSKCRHSTWWFQPGTYYFDFHNAGTTRNRLLDGGSGNVWTINDGYLVAGTPIDGNGAKVATPAVPAAIPGACDNPIYDAEAAGVQFIFGGDSQMVVRAGQAEICGSYSATKPPVAVYGLTAGSGSAVATTGLSVTGVPTAGDFGAGATVANLATIDGTKYATWTSQNNNDRGSVTVDGFAPPSAIPAGSILTNATVRVVHRHADAATTDNVSVAVTPSGGTAVTATLTGHQGGAAWQTDQATVDAGTDEIAKAVYAGSFTGARIAVTAGPTAKNDTEDIDAIQLDLAYVPPALRAGTGCVTTGPYTGGSATSCALISSTGSPNNQFYVQGTTYAPRAALDLTLNNATEQVFRFGVIARSLRVKETGSFSYTGPVIEVPDDAPGYAFMVYLTAYVCPAASSCPPGGTGALRAKVTVVDDDPMNPVAGRRQIAILSWVPSG